VSRKLRVVPSTLAEAHDVLWRERPAQGADLREWVVFHRHSAEVYTETAKVDQRHYHEAVQCAGIEIRKARAIEDQLDPTLRGDDS
jgi:hypothetical protein